jgi:hypothetical protein
LQTKVDNDDESVDSGMPGLQTRHSEDTSSDDDNDYDKKPTKASTKFNGKFQLTTPMGRSLLVNVSANNAQNEMQNVCTIVAKRLH